MKTTTIHIGGMTCVNCQNRIEKKLKSTAGIETATVSFNTQQFSFWKNNVLKQQNTDEICMK